MKKSMMMRTRTIIENKEIKVKREPVIEKPIIELSEKHFDEDLLEVLILATKPENKEKFFSCEKRSEFLEKVAEELKKAKYVQNRTALKEERDQFIAVINEDLERLIQQLSNKAVSINEMEKSENKDEIKALIRWILMSVLETISDIKGKNTVEARKIISEMTVMAVNKGDVILYLALHYIKNHSAEFKLPKTKEKELNSAAENYTSIFQQEQTYNTVKEELDILKIQFEFMKKEFVKKDKVIEAKKNEVGLLNDRNKKLTKTMQENEKNPIIKQLEKINSEMVSEKKKALELEKLNKAMVTKSEYEELQKITKKELKAVKSEMQKIETEKSVLQERLDETLEGKENWIEYNLVEEFTAYLEKNGLTENLKAILKPYLEKHVDRLEALPEAATSPAENYFGYCDVIRPRSLCC